MTGELLYGLLARHRALSGARTAADHATELFGRRAAVATFDLPCRLDALAERLPAGAGLDGAGLLSHTLYTYYAAFQTQDTRAAVENDLRVSESSNAHHRLGVAAFRVRAGEALRFCPDCVDQQVKYLGMATWLVAHQLPSALVCTVHGSWLLDSLVTRATAGRHGYVTPSKANCPRIIADDGRRSKGASLSLLMELAVASATLSASMAPARPLEYWRAHYVQRLAGVGLMRSACKVDQVALNEGLRAHWGPVLSHLPASCSSFAETGWAAEMVRSHRKAMHPLFHLLLDVFVRHLEGGGAVPDILGPEKTQTMVASYSSTKRISSPLHPVTGRSPRFDWLTLDEKFCLDISCAVAEIHAVVPPVRVSVAEIERRVAKAEWFSKRRRKLPAALRMLAKAQEPLDAYRLRRAEYWIRKLGSSCRAWEVMRAAGLRSEHLPMIRRVMAARTAASVGR